MERKHLKPASRRKPRLPRWAQAAFYAAFVGMMVLLAVGLVTKIARPYREVRQQRTQLSGSRAELATLNAKNAALRQRIAYLKTAEGQTAEARRLGFVRPGEVPFVVVEGAISTAAAPAARP